MSACVAATEIGERLGQASFSPKEPTGFPGRLKTQPAFGMGLPTARDSFAVKVRR